MFQREVGSTVLLLLFLLFAALSYTKYVTVVGQVAVRHHGVICSVYNIFNYAAPLSAMVSIIFVIRKSKLNLIGLDQGPHDRTC